MLANAERTVLLADSSTLGRTASHRFGSLADVYTLITDSAAAPGVAEELRACGPDAIIAPQIGR